MKKTILIVVCCLTLGVFACGEKGGSTTNGGDSTNKEKVDSSQNADVKGDENKSSDSTNTSKPDSTGNTDSTKTEKNDSEKTN